MAEVCIPATVIGSWAFPGWYDALNADLAVNPQRYGAADRAEALRDAVLVVVDDQLRA